MKTALNYMVCSTALFVAIMLIASGSLLWTMTGFMWCGGLYVSGLAFPRYWRRFWITNLRILSLMGCL